MPSLHCLFFNMMPFLVIKDQGRSPQRAAIVGPGEKSPQSVERAQDQQRQPAAQDIAWAVGDETSADVANDSLRERPQGPLHDGTRLVRSTDHDGWLMGLISPTIEHEIEESKKENYFAHDYLSYSSSNDATRAVEPA
jgi:hypothetical protein